ncbi:MAG: roadblock/LC7 domain-containing protein, partial [Myxococcota bacterium]|nr:roadblock/LC7 domain-containing protein [Myxococcota bacterium]
MSRAEQMMRQLKTLSNNTPDVEAAAVIDNDGLSIASALPQDVDDDSVAAM